MIEEHIPKAELAFVDSFERFYRENWQLPEGWGETCLD